MASWSRYGRQSYVSCLFLVFCLCRILLTLFLVPRGKERENPGWASQPRPDVAHFHGSLTVSKLKQKIILFMKRLCGSPCEVRTRTHPYHATGQYGRIPSNVVLVPPMCCFSKPALLLQQDCREPSLGGHVGFRDEYLCR